MSLFSRTKVDRRGGARFSAPPSPTRANDRTTPSGTRPDEDSHHLRVLGLSPGASSEEIRRAHARLVADLTPGPEASHRNVALAKSLLDEVNRAFTSLRLSSVA